MPCKQELLKNHFTVQLKTLESLNPGILLSARVLDLPGSVAPGHLSPEFPPAERPQVFGGLVHLLCPEGEAGSVGSSAPVWPPLTLLSVSEHLCSVSAQQPAGPPV